MWLADKINTAFYFYNYCYDLCWKKLWKKKIRLQIAGSGNFFPILCFIFYVFLLAVILWRLGIHARWSSPFMFGVDILIVVYGAYLGSNRKLKTVYFEKFDRKIPSFGLLYLIFWSPFIIILVTLFLAKPLLRL